MGSPSLERAFFSCNLTFVYLFLIPYFLVFLCPFRPRLQTGRFCLAHIYVQLHIARARSVIHFFPRLNVKKKIHTNTNTTLEAKTLY